jgi:MFS family permease
MSGWALHFPVSWPCSGRCISDLDLLPASGPLAGRLADYTHQVRGALAIASLMAAAFALCFAIQSSFLIVLFISLAYAAALAPTASLADALALRSSRTTSSSVGEYGWARGSGSAAFVIGSLLSGQMIGMFAPVLIWQATCLMLAAGAALVVPAIRIQGDGPAERVRAGYFALQPTLCFVGPFGRACAWKPRNA